MQYIMSFFWSLFITNSRHSQAFSAPRQGKLDRLTYGIRTKSISALGLSSETKNLQPPLKLNLLTIHEEELQTLLQSWKQPKYRAKQIIEWIKERGILDIDEMNNIPKSLRTLLKDNTTIGSLKLEVEMVSKDGTKKRAYRLHDGQLIESVLMPYEDGRNTACISSQAGCAMACKCKIDFFGPCFEFVAQ